MYEKSPFAGQTFASFGTAKRFCRKCLTKDMPDALYQERLSLCRQCESLLNGMCRICGCFVEMRAAVAKNYCPAINKKW